MADELQLRPMEQADLPEVLALNEEHVAVLSPLDAERLAWILGLADVALVVTDDAGVVGFCIALWDGTAYDSPHYAWFAERYERFLYLDRVAVDARARRRGVGSLLYDTAETIARRAGRMLLEVDAEPPNDASLAFHGHRGYMELERVRRDDGKVLAMFAKELD